MRNSNKQLVMGVLAVGLVGGALIAGIYLGKSMSLDQETQEDWASSASQGSGPLDHSQQGEQRDSSSPRVGENRYVGLSDLVEYSSDFSRTAALYSLLDRAGKKDLVNLIEQSKEITPKSVQFSTQQLIFQRLAMVDAIAAIGATEKFPKHRQDALVEAVFGEWSQSNLDQAVNHAKKLEEPKKLAALKAILRSREDISESLRREIARELGSEQTAIALIAHSKTMESMDNPEQAWQTLVGDTNPDLSQVSLLTQVASAWVRQDGLSVLDEISKSLKDWNTRTAVIRSILQDAARINPQETLNQVMRLPKERMEEMTHIVAREWALTNPHEAFDAMASVEPSGLRRQFQESVVRAWASSSPQSLLDELSYLPETLQGVAREQAILAISKHDPEEAVALLSSIDDDNSLHMIAYSIAASWSHSDPVAAVEWVLNSPDLHKMQYELLSLVFRNLAAEDPQLAMELALKQPIEGHHRGLEAAIIARLVEIDLQRALAMLSQVRQGRTQLAAYTSVGSSLVRNAEPGRALKLANQLEPEWRDSYYDSIMSAWASSDPEGLLGILNDLPSNAIKSKAAVSLARQNRFREVLTSEQLAYAKSYMTEEDAKRANEGWYHSFGWSEGAMFVTSSDHLVADEVIVTESVEPLIRLEIQSKLEESEDD